MQFSTFVALATLTIGSWAYKPFSVYPLSTHEPTGDPDGQANYYHINFTVTSSNGASPETGICYDVWSDNAWTDSEVYSKYVPTGSWIACTPSTFSFQLHPYFTIGNFTLSVQHNFTDPTNGTQMLASGTTQVVNNTADYTCLINPTTSPYIQHSSGDCTIPTSESPKAIPISSTNQAPGPCSAATVSTTFLVQADTSSSQTVLVTGSIPELGNWDTTLAVPLASSDKASAWPTWAGSVDIAAGTSFEYKYLMQNTDDGSVTWECCENRNYEVPTGTCGASDAGNDPDMFRG